MSTLGEIVDSLNWLRDGGCKEIALLHCVTSYPAKFEDVNLRVMQTFQQAFDVPIGFSDHTLGIAVPLAAVALGAKLIEKHFTLDKNMVGPDHKASLEPEEMKSMIEERTNVNGAGSGVYNINPEVSDIPDKFKVSGKDGLQLLVLGGIEEPASGCLCPENALIRTLLYNLFVKRDEVVIVDFEAGLEHLGRGTAKGIDVMLVITEPSQKSLDLCSKIISLSKKLGVINIFLIANKITEDSQLAAINKRIKNWEIPLYHSISFDSEIGKADLNGISWSIFVKTT